MLHRNEKGALAQASYPVLLAICLIVSCAAFLNTTSTLLAPLAPRAAVTVNPLNMNARVDHALGVLGGEYEENLAQLHDFVSAGVIQAPRDARPLSLLGIIETQRQNTALAQQFFKRALALLPTEIQALNHSLAFAVRNGEYDRAVDYLEIIGRRWSKTWSNVEPVLPALIADESAYRSISDSFSGERLRDLLINSLARQDQTLTYAYSLLASWHEMGIDGLDGLINRVTSQFIRHDRYTEAFLLFRLTRSDDRGAGGFVYNGDFELPISGNPFDWRLKGQSGVDMQIVNRPVQFARAGDPENFENSLALRFLNNPIRFDNVSQLTRLAPGNYRLAAVYSSNDLRTPQPLKIGIECLGGRDEIGVALFEPGDVERQEAAFLFRVPPADCGLQRVRIFNENMTESWKNRYAGTLYLHAVTVTLLGT